jgi:hypothetical protein
MWKCVTFYTSTDTLDKHPSATLIEKEAKQVTNKKAGSEQSPRAAHPEVSTLHRNHSKKRKNKTIHLRPIELWDIKVPQFLDFWFTDSS